MKLLGNLQLALVILLLTDIATFDLRLRKSKILTEGTCPKKKFNLKIFSSGKEEESTEKSGSALKLASCGIKEKPCGKERNSCGQKESTECPLCGRELCPQQQKSSCPLQKNGCQAQKSGCSHQKPSCPQTKPKCPSASKPSCPQAAKPKCPPPPKPACPQEKPACPERCSVFRKFAFPTVTNIKYQATTTENVEHKPGKCPPNCSGGAACKGKPAK